jgi:hypothetical protein
VQENVYHSICVVAQALTATLEAAAFVVINYKSLGNILYLENTNIDIVKSLIISFDYVN